jgi:general secretion pathway protein C
MSLDGRARRLLRRVPRTNVYSFLELALLSLLAIQCARLFWMLVTPVGPIGEWRAAGAARPPAPEGLLSTFDPFFRLGAGGGPVAVTALNLKLFGVREDRASGRGSAIIGTADGQQRSYSVGEEVLPGVKLVGVAFDNVTLSRGGASEQLFLDQGRGAKAAAPAAQPQLTIPTPAIGAPAQAPGAEIAFQPRLNAGKVTGILLMPQGTGNAFRAAGFAPGDVLITVDGRPVTSAEEVQSAAARLAGGDSVNVEVERAGRIMPMKVRIGR